VLPLFVGVTNNSYNFQGLALKQNTHSQVTSFGSFPELPNTGVKLPLPSGRYSNLNSGISSSSDYKCDENKEKSV
jgi:hypothetical protein